MAELYQTKLQKAVLKHLFITFWALYAVSETPNDAKVLQNSAQGPQGPPK